MARYIPSIAWEQRLLEVFSGYLEVLGTLGFTAPYVAGLALLSVRGYVMAVDPNYFASGARRLDRDHLLTDEVLVEDPSQSADEILRPLFDQVWNACGWPRSINYDESGRWGRRA